MQIESLNGSAEHPARLILSYLQCLHYDYEAEESILYSIIEKLT